MSLFDQGITSFAVFEDAVEFVGMAQVVLPNLSAVTQELRGAGLGGSIEAIYPGQFQAMTMSMNFNSPSKQSLKLATPKRHTLELRLAVQTEDTVEGIVGTQAQKHVVVVVPKTYTGGTIAPASTTGGSGEYAVRYWACYIDGEKYLEIDPMNFIGYIDGVDYLADVRAALGK